jgi:GDPmannose 4,6-dehydratase
MCADYFNIPIAWEGEGRDKVARNVVTGDIVIKTNDIYYRPVDVVNLLGDASKAKQLLNWEPEYTLQNLVEEMCEYDALAINAE